MLIIPKDWVGETTDSYVPIYYRDLAECLADDLSIAELKDDGLAEGVTDVFNRIQIAITNG